MKWCPGDRGRQSLMQQTVWTFESWTWTFCFSLAVLCLGKCGWGDDVEEREAWQPGKAISPESGAELWASVSVNTKSWPLLSTQNISYGNLHLKMKFKMKFRIHSKKGNAKLFAAKASQSRKQASHFWGLSPNWWKSSLFLISEKQPDWCVQSTGARLMARNVEKDLFKQLVNTSSKR